MTLLFDKFKVASISSSSSSASSALAFSPALDRLRRLKSIFWKSQQQRYRVCFMLTYWKQLKSCTATRQWLSSKNQSDQDLAELSTRFYDHD
ncbi:438_t:CDS:1, partial [Paraglomus brasilianum]